MLRKNFWKKNVRKKFRKKNFGKKILKKKCWKKVLTKKINHVNDFFIRGSTCMAIALYISPPTFSPFSSFFPFPLSFTFFPPVPPPPLPVWDCDCSHSLQCCITFAPGHRENPESLRRYSWPFNRVCPQSTVSKIMTSRSALRCAGRRSTVTHPSTNPAPSCSTRVIARYRTPFFNLHNNSVENLMKKISNK